MQKFLAQNYYSLSEIAQHCHVTEAEILRLQTAQCIPGHSYQIRNIAIFSSTVAEERTNLTTLRYYHRSIAVWVRNALLALQTMSFTKLALQIKEDFAKQFATVFAEMKTPGCQDFDQAWGSWIDGTWGVCLKEITILCMAKKELARQDIAEFMEQDAATISVESRAALTTAVRSYIAASLDFDPYGIRHILAVEAIDKFHLQVEIDNKYLGC